MRCLLVLACLAMLAGCGGGNAGPLTSASATDLRFVGAVATWDLNRDGKVTCAEWKQYATSLFKNADGDRDSFLARQEFDAMSRQDRLFATIGFAYFDANGDGRMTLPELADKPNPAFALLDKDSDCAISSEERINLEAKRPDVDRRPTNPVATDPVSSSRSGRPGGY